MSMSTGAEFNLRNLRVLMLLPRDEPNESLVRVLKRCGGVVERHWPPPSDLEGESPDIVVYLACDETRHISRTLADQGRSALVAVVDPSDPRAFSNSVEANTHAILTAPFDGAVVLTSIVLAHNNSLYQRRLLNKVAKLEETLRSIRKVERAKLILMRDQKLDEAGAYAHLRDQAMRRRVPIGTVAGAVIEYDELLTGGTASTAHP